MDRLFHSISCFKALVDIGFSITQKKEKLFLLTERFFWNNLNIILDYTIHNIKNNFSLREMVVPTNGAEREQERGEVEEELEKGRGG